MEVFIIYTYSSVLTCAYIFMSSNIFRLEYLRMREPVVDINLLITDIVATIIGTVYINNEL